MKKYVIITDSTTDLPQDYVEKHEIEVIPMKFSIDGNEYSNYLDGREMDSKTFYDLERNGKIAKTAQLTIVDIENVYRKYLDLGYDILAIGFSSGLSGTFNSMRLAKEELEEEYKDNKIMIIDSLCACLGEGLFVYYAVQNKLKGLDLEANYNNLLELRPHLCHWFTVLNLDTLRRGGRVSNVAAFVADTLNIKPVLHVDDAGHLIAMKKVVGRKRSLLALVDKLSETIYKDEPQMIMIGHGDCLEDALFVAEEVKKRVPVKDILINCIGPVIGAHSGPGTLALFFVGTKR